MPNSLRSHVVANNCRHAADGPPVAEPDHVVHVVADEADLAPGPEAAYGPVRPADDLPAPYRECLASEGLADLHRLLAQFDELEDDVRAFLDAHDPHSCGCPLCEYLEPDGNWQEDLVTVKCVLSAFGSSLGCNIPVPAALRARRVG